MDELDTRENLNLHVPEFGTSSALVGVHQDERIMTRNFSPENNSWGEIQKYTLPCVGSEPQGESIASQVTISP